MMLTYLSLLGLFLIVPILLLTLLTLWDRKRLLPKGLRARSPYSVLIVLIVVALLYTTPWDHHLIATHVWWYALERISGVAFGQIPLEELTFFVLQTILVGLWFIWLARRLPSRPIPMSTTKRGVLRLLSVVVVCGIWLIALIVLRSGWQPGTYLGWELVWALPPIMLQLAVGADLLWQYRRVICLSLFPALIYLCSVDALAIHQGIWTINPQQSLNIFIGRQLPIEEFVFFLLTTGLVVIGFLLGLSLDLKRVLIAYLGPFFAITRWCSKKPE